MSSETPRNRRLPARTLAVVGVVVVIAIVAAGIATRAVEARHLKTWTDAQAVQSVHVVAPVQVGHGPTLDLPGRLDAFEQAPIFARVSGYLKSWSVDIGTPVKAGQLLALIDTPELDQQLQQARADLRSAQANASLAGIAAKRWQALQGSDSVAQQDIDQRTSDFAARQASVAAAQANVDRLIAMKGFARIVAPFAGTITSRDTDIGALIDAGKGGAGQQLFTVSDVRQLRVYVEVPQNFAPSIQPGTKVQLTVPAFPAERFEAHVIASAGAVNPESGTTRIQLLVNNDAGRLMPGGYASVAFALPANAGTLSIPASALVFDGRGLTVATAGADDRVTYRKVAISRDLGKTVEIQSGLQPGDRVIDTPPDGLADGDKVRISAARAKAVDNG